MSACPDLASAPLCSPLFALVSILSLFEFGSQPPRRVSHPSKRAAFQSAACLALAEDGASHASVNPTSAKAGRARSLASNCISVLNHARDRPKPDRRPARAPRLMLLLVIQCVPCRDCAQINPSTTSIPVWLEWVGSSFLWLVVGPFFIFCSSEDGWIPDAVIRKSGIYEKENDGLGRYTAARQRNSDAEFHLGPGFRILTSFWVEFTRKNVTPMQILHCRSELRWPGPFFSCIVLHLAASGEKNARSN